jgi:hypothetical protein
VDGLESIALDPASPERTVTGAVALLIVAGGTEASVPRDDILARLERIYERRTDTIIRSTVLGVAVFLADQEGAISFIRQSIARTRDDEVALSAIRSLSANGGSLGRQALREIYANDAVASSAARALLTTLSRTDFMMRRDTVEAGSV